MRPVETRWNLLGKRAVIQEGGQPTHITSRHVVMEGKHLRRPSGRPFTQGGLFPKNVRAGEACYIERYVKAEYEKWRRGLDSEVKWVKNAGGALCVKLSLGKFGVKDLTAFIRQNEVCTAYPVKTQGCNRILYKGRKTKKT